jgi:hypothetical protein
MTKGSSDHAGLGTRYFINSSIHSFFYHCECFAEALFFQQHTLKLVQPTAGRRVHCPLT